MWMHKLFFASRSDKIAATRWIAENVGYFEFDACLEKEPYQLKFYTSVELPESEQATIKAQTKATEYLMEEL